MPWGVSTEKKKEPVEPTVSERDVLVFNINEVSNDTLESTRYSHTVALEPVRYFLAI
jgi:hypothetical protein